MATLEMLETLLETLETLLETLLQTLETLETFGEPAMGFHRSRSVNTAFGEQP